MSSRWVVCFGSCTFWRNANALVEQAYWSGTGAFVLSAENLTVVNGKAVSRPGDPAAAGLRPCQLYPAPAGGAGHRDRSGVCLRVQDRRQARSILTTHTGNETRRTIRNEWFRTSGPVSGVPDFRKMPAPPGMVESITVTGSPPWFSLFSPAAVKNIPGGDGLGMSVFAEALAEAQGIDLAFDNYREDIRLGHKKIFYSADICRKVVDKDGAEHAIPPDDDVVSQFVTLPEKAGSLR